jgi:hypothetical protein
MRTKAQESRFLGFFVRSGPLPDAESPGRRICNLSAQKDNPRHFCRYSTTFIFSDAVEVFSLGSFVRVVVVTAGG